MTVYVDTSAFLAVLDADGRNHGSARRVWSELLEEEALVCNSYVLVETFAIAGWE